jgi:hypothetical protein
MIMDHERFNKRTLYAIAVSADIKDILYCTIDKIGKEKIRMEIIAKIERSQEFCNEILDVCKLKIGCDLNDETYCALCEALLHFMLTASLLPSERKVRSKGAELDIVVPSLKMLSKSPAKALILQIIKKDVELAKIKQAESVQPCYENIWIVSARRLETDHKNYYIDSEPFPYCMIISDINAFLAREGYRALKLLHG